MNARFFALVCALCLVPVLGAAPTRAAPPELAACRLDAGYRIDPAATPAALRPLLGVYWGRWADAVPHTLVVEQLAADGRFAALYAWGRVGENPAGCDRVIGRFDDEALHLALATGAVADYRVVDGAAALDGLWRGPDHDARATGRFQRIAPGDWAAGAPTAIAFAALAPTSDEGKLCPADVLVRGDVDGPGQDFIGVFEGRWHFRGALDHTLVITEVDADGAARGYYAHGRFRGWGVEDSGCYPIAARVEDGELVVPLRRGVTATYWLDGPDEVTGRYDWGGDIGSGVPRYIGGSFARAQ